MSIEENVCIYLKVYGAMFSLHIRSVVCQCLLPALTKVTGSHIGMVSYSL